MAAVANIGAGMYLFQVESVSAEEAERDRSWVENFREKLQTVMMIQEIHGWDSPECQVVRIDMMKWQRFRKGEDHGSESEIVSECG